MNRDRESSDRSAIGASAGSEVSVRSLVPASSLPEAIQWHEGMLLSPQHFQQLSSYHEQQIQYQAAAIAPFSWGVRRLEIDREALLSGIFRVAQLEAILPDGLVVTLAEGVDLQLELTGREQELEAGALPVYLGVVARRQGAMTVGGERARYDSAKGRAVLDENTGEGELRIPRLRPRLQLFLGETPPADVVGLPLAKIRYRDNKFVLLTNYLPPSFRVSRESPIGQMCSAIVRRVWEKADVLLKVKVPSVAGHTPQLLETKLMIQALVTAAPRFHGLLRTEVSHPFALYLELCSLAGAMAVLTEDLLPPSLPAYDHNDLYATFDESRREILKALDSSIVESFTDYRFKVLERQRVSVYYIEFSEEWKQQTLIIGVRAGSQMSEKDVYDWMESSLIGSRSLIQDIERMRIRGAERQRIEGDGQLIPARGVVLFTLDNASEFIKANETLLISNPNSQLKPQEIVLFVKNEAGAERKTVEVI